MQKTFPGLSTVSSPVWTSQIQLHKLFLLCALVKLVIWSAPTFMSESFPNRCSPLPIFSPFLFSFFCTYLYCVVQVPLPHIIPFDSLSLSLFWIVIRYRAVMKFGDTFRQRSIPEWSSCSFSTIPCPSFGLQLINLDNVDYDELKQLIKERTSKRSTTGPVSIPGQGNTDAAWGQLQDDLFPILSNQHERVNLFTRSKYGEFERRMDYIDRQARLLTGQKTERFSQPVQNTRRYAKLVQEADSVGEDIQSLSRYVATQKQAFRKILKKYRKWTGSSGLELRMNNETFCQPGSALSLDFMPLLDRLARTSSSLTALSHPHGNAGEQPTPQHRKSSATVPRKSKSIASRLHGEFLHSSPLEFDAAFSIVPLGMAGGRASYWVHRDNLEEVTVLLRRYMRDRNVSLSPSTSSSTSLNSLPSTRRDSLHSAVSKARVHISMFDNLHRFIKARGAVTVGQAEDLIDSVSSMLAMSILWSSDPKAIVLTSDLSPSAAPIQRHVDIAHVKRKDLVKLFVPEGRPPTRCRGGSTRKPPISDINLEVHRDWLALNRDVKPLAEVQCTRSRFAGLNNTSEVGTWALMDNDITLSSVDTSTIGNSTSDDATDVQSFPHTVLDVRWEFSRSPEVVRALDSTHLVQRIRGFSMEAQAISSICQPSDMPSTMWQAWLERDIRKVPPLQTRRNLRKTPTKAAGSERSSAESSSIFSIGAINSSATSLQESSRSTPPSPPLKSRQDAVVTPRSTNKTPPRRKFRQERQAIQRYWNEFDDGDEVTDDQRYAIYVNPDEQTYFPGAKPIRKALSSMYQSLGRTQRRIISWLPMQSRGGGRDHDIEEGVRRPLLGLHKRDAEYDNDESSDTDPSLPIAKSSNRRCSTVRPPITGARRTSLLKPRHITKPQYFHTSHETALFRTYLGCYFIAFVLLIMSAIMRATGRHKAQVQVDAGVLVGVIAALGSAIIAISLMISREEKLGWLHRALGGGAFLVVCAGSGWLLAPMGERL